MTLWAKRLDVSAKMAEKNMHGHYNILPFAYSVLSFQQKGKI